MANILAYLGQGVASNSASYLLLSAEPVLPKSLIK